MAPIDNIAGAETVDFLRPLSLMLPITVEDVRQAYLAKANAAHPDAGGDIESFKRLQRAYEQALAYARRHSFGWIRSMVETHLAQQQVIEKVKALGGYVDIEKIEWLKREIGDDFVLLSEKVVGIYLHEPQVDDEVLGCLLKERNLLAGLRWLDVAGTRITYKGLKLLRWLPSLQWLGIHGTPVRWWQRVKIQWSLPNLNFFISWADVAKSSSFHRPYSSFIPSSP